MRLRTPDTLQTRHLIPVATAVILAFGLLYPAFGGFFVSDEGPPLSAIETFAISLHHSVLTFTLTGSNYNVDGSARWLTMLEAIMGFGFLALLISTLRK